MALLGKFVKTFCGFVAVLALGLLCAYCILKSSQASFVQNVDFNMVFVPLMATLVFATMLYLCSSRTALPIINSSYRAGGTEDRDFISALSPLSILLFHEAETFRGIILILAYVLLATYNVFLHQTECSSCKDPYLNIAITLALFYGIRGILMIVKLCTQHSRYRLMVHEVDFYQLFRKDHRFFKKALKDMKPHPRTATLWWINICLVAASLILMVSMAVWVFAGDCVSICPDTVAVANSVYIGGGIVESCYLFTALFQWMYKGTSGVAAIEAMSLRASPDSEDGESEQDGLLKA